MIRVHDKKIDRCTFCEKDIPKMLLRQHIRTVHGRVIQAHCEVCNKIIRGENELKRHIQTVHEKKKNVKCNHCEKNLSSRGKLKLHIAVVHQKFLSGQEPSALAAS